MQFWVKTTRQPKNWLTYMLDSIVMQMRKVNCDKGYCNSTHCSLHGVIFYYCIACAHVTFGKLVSFSHSNM